LQRRDLTTGRRTGIHWRVRSILLVFCLATIVLVCPAALAQQPAVTPKDLAEAEVMEDPVPPEVEASAVAAVAKLGDEVVLGRYQTAIDRMNPVWKERTAARMGGMAELEKKLAGVAAEMVRQGISMISFKPQGKPRIYQVSPRKSTIKVGGKDVERLVFTQWLVLVPTETKFRIMREGEPRPLIIESTGYQVAVSDKGANNWTFIDGAGLKPADLRGIYITLPQDMELPSVEKREVR
jgi:hypothetical protein